MAKDKKDMEPTDVEREESVATDEHVDEVDEPDVPKLADGVVLSGQMEESAFVEEPALVQKDGRFIQLTELLFLIVKNVDGKRSIDDIAAAVSKEHEKEITADEVRKLTAEKLLPIGRMP